MKCAGCWFLALFAAWAWTATSRAQSVPGYGHPPGAAAPSGAPDSQPKARPPARAPVFAAGSAANARPMTVPQREEMRFLKDAWAANRFQADASTLALARSNTPSIRSLAAGVLEQQHADGEQLLRMLHQRSLAPPMLANTQRKTLNRLARLQGRAFDREFLVQAALRARQEEVLEYERAATTLSDPALKAWVDQSLPALKSQLAAAQRIALSDPRPVRGLDAVQRSPSSGAPRAVGTRPSEWNSR